jgi:hypothetical protein
LVTITLTNSNPHSQNKQVTIDINQGTCSFTNDKKISLKQLINNPDFTHPLLSEPFTQPPDYLFHYEYDNIEGLLYSGIFVFSRLIHTDKPLQCTFKINPSPLFKYAQCADRIYLSIDRDKAANEYINKRQLEFITSQLMGLKFVFSENIIIDDLFTTKDLLGSINGDLLYKSNAKLIALLKKPKDFSSCEIRYISPEVGFGVFARNNIKQGDIISFYTGIKNNNKISFTHFSFRPNKDCLSMDLDAFQYGNITRFINHAPNEKASDNKNIKNSPSKCLLTANLKASFKYINGIEFVVYVAIKDILTGEQLLVSYGDHYFQQIPMIRFKSNGHLINTKKKYIWNSSKKKIHYIKIMAEAGVKKARVYLIVRLIVILAILYGAFQGMLMLTHP